MDIFKRALKGSPSRDDFKRKHKDLSKYFYATDIDFCLMSKHPPGIVAFLDYKKLSDRVTFTEAMAYMELVKATPVYIVEGDNPKTGPFTIREFISANWRPEPPIVTWGKVVEIADWDEFEEWEGLLRETFTRDNSPPGILAQARARQENA